MRSTSGLFQSLDDIKFVVAAGVRVAVPAPVGSDYDGVETLDADRIGRDERLPRLAAARRDVQPLDRDWRNKAAARDVEETSVSAPLSRIIAAPSSETWGAAARRQWDRGTTCRPATPALTCHQESPLFRACEHPQA